MRTVIPPEGGPYQTSTFLWQRELGSTHWDIIQGNLPKDTAITHLGGRFQGFKVSRCVRVCVTGISTEQFRIPLPHLLLCGGDSGETQEYHCTIKFYVDYTHTCTCAYTHTHTHTHTHSCVSLRWRYTKPKT